MKENRIALLIFSVALYPIWELLLLKNLVSGKLFTFLVLLSVIITVFSCIKLINSFKIDNQYFKWIFIIFLIYELIIIIRGWSFDYYDLKTYLLRGYVLWPFIIPFFIFFDKKMFTLGLLVKWIYNLSLFFIFINLIFPRLLMERSTAEYIIGLAVTSGFILLIASYISNRKVNVAFFAMFISLLSVIFLARRSAILTILGYIISAYLINIFYKSKTLLFKIFPVITISLIFAFLLFSNFSESITKKLIMRFSEDTRTGLYEMYFYDMIGNLDFGKGLNGTYYYPLSGGMRDDGVMFTEVEYRNIVENGYLQLILTGGILHVVLYLLILLPAAILGIFYSSNQFTTACGIVIFLWLIDMVFYGLPRLSLHYVLVWISVGICYTKTIRLLTNEEIRTEFNRLGL